MQRGRFASRIRLTREQVRISQDTKHPKGVPTRSVGTKYVYELSIY
ncbi:Uncharacterized protein dnm_090930 [Desulfonema magnum]|uniref:Uncharacterized protein n=1 Tax=Desulfonema magnum TaxID=45655 RepID=A0A975GTD1_9BACT|nr:Uncharacterized protein dnm_090930 [Desulfonema magnum]